MASLGGLALSERPKVRLLVHRKNCCPAMPHLLSYRARHLWLSSLLCAKHAQLSLGGTVTELSHPELPWVTLGFSLVAPQCFEINRPLCVEEARVWSFLKESSWARRGRALLPLPHPFCTRTPPIMPRMQPLLWKCLWKAAAQLEGSPQKWLQGSMGVWPSKSWVFLPQK